MTTKTPKAICADLLGRVNRIVDAWKAANPRPKNVDRGGPLYRAAFNEWCARMELERARAMESTGYNAAAADWEASRLPIVMLSGLQQAARVLANSEAERSRHGLPRFAFATEWDRKTRTQVVTAYRYAPDHCHADDQII